MPETPLHLDTYVNLANGVRGDALRRDLEAARTDAPQLRFANFRRLADQLTTRRTEAAQQLAAADAALRAIDARLIKDPRQISGKPEDVYWRDQKGYATAQLAMYNELTAILKPHLDAEGIVVAATVDGLHDLQKTIPQKKAETAEAIPSSPDRDRMVREKMIAFLTTNGFVHRFASTLDRYRPEVRTDTEGQLVAHEFARFTVLQQEMWMGGLNAHFARAVGADGTISPDKQAALVRAVRDSIATVDQTIRVVSHGNDRLRLEDLTQLGAEGKELGEKLKGAPFSLLEPYLAGKKPGIPDGPGHPRRRALLTDWLTARVRETARVTAADGGAKQPNQPAQFDAEAVLLRDTHFAIEYLVGEKELTTAEVESVLAEVNTKLASEGEAQRFLGVVRGGDEKNKFSVDKLLENDGRGAISRRADERADERETPAKFGDGSTVAKNGGLGEFILYLGKELPLIGGVITILLGKGFPAAQIGMYLFAGGYLAQDKITGAFTESKAGVLNRKDLKEFADDVVPQDVREMAVLLDPLAFTQAGTPLKTYLTDLDRSGRPLDLKTLANYVPKKPEAYRARFLEMIKTIGPDDPRIDQLHAILTDCAKKELPPSTVIRGVDKAALKDPSPAK